MLNKVCYAIIGILYISIALFLFPGQYMAEEEDQSIIIEVDGDVKKHAEYVEKYFPYIDVVATYDTLFNGMALKGSSDKLHKIATLEFIESVHPVRTYEIPASRANGKDLNRSVNHSSLTRYSEDDFSEQDSSDTNITLPNETNDTSYTGKGVQVGVIDTGIDYTHPDLKGNYKGGYDLVDLDDDPMETKGSPIEETIHGSHVAGIIAANGTLKGVAPDAEIHAYRALGPGGMGSTVQVLAALEKAVKDDMDLVNLSLGNTVNGPDYPTSIAVNRAVDLGTTVVIAAGNDGPDAWTLGSPGTAAKSITVGATAAPMEIPLLRERLYDKSLALESLLGALPWDLQKDYQVVALDDQDTSLRGKIAIQQRGEVPFYDMAKKAQDQGARALLIVNNETGPISGSVENEKEPVNIPVAALSDSDGEWVFEHMGNDALYLDTDYKETPYQVADFSSRGPVTINWDIKPDILAPGVNIMSTVPEGYQMLQGTSMAAPHITGVLALVKEAHPDWNPDQLKAAIETTAEPLKKKDDTLYKPQTQGMGSVQAEKAVSAHTSIRTPSLSFGKMDQGEADKTQEMTISNTSDQPQTYSFTIPKSKQGITWDIPKTFTVNPKEEKTIEVGIRTMPAVLKKGIHQGHLTLEGEADTYQLPYLFLNKTADYPKAMGFEFSLNPLNDDTYQYQLYLTEQTKQVTVNLYNPDSLIHQRSLLELKDLDKGMNEGEIKRAKAGEPGLYKAIITIELENGTFESYETEVVI